MIDVADAERTARIGDALVALPLPKLRGTLDGKLGGNSLCGSKIEPQAGNRGGIT
jgi:hypothetical protein